MRWLNEEMLTSLEHLLKKNLEIDEIDEKYIQHLSPKNKYKFNKVRITAPLH